MVIAKKQPEMPSQFVIPFNACRFDAAMAILGAKQNNRRVFTQRELVKYHVMIDVFHVLEHGKQVIGGTFKKWVGGAVCAPSYNRVRTWAYRWDEDQSQPDNFRIVGNNKKIYYYKPDMVVDPSYFSDSEIDAIGRAWDLLSPMTFRQSNEFFHSGQTYMGRAWLKTPDNGIILWDNIIDAYAEDHPEYRRGELAKALMSLGD